MNKQDLPAKRIEAGEKLSWLFARSNHFQWNRTNPQDEMSSATSLGDGLMYQGKNSKDFHSSVNRRVNGRMLAGSLTELSTERATNCRTARIPIFWRANGGEHQLAAVLA
jgi:hypothetical protein